MPSRILFLDDEASVHFAVTEFLGARGHRVDCASDAASALARIASASYDLVIADLRLSQVTWPWPEPEGFAFIERVHREHPATRVLVLSACGDDLGDEALRRGADAYLQKPQPLERLALAIEVLGRGPR